MDIPYQLTKIVVLKLAKQLSSIVQLSKLVLTVLPFVKNATVLLLAKIAILDTLGKQLQLFHNVLKFNAEKAQDLIRESSVSAQNHSNFTVHLTISASQNKLGLQNTTQDVVKTTIHLVQNATLVFLVVLIAPEAAFNSVSNVKLATIRASRSNTVQSVQTDVQAASILPNVLRVVVDFT